MKTILIAVVFASSTLVMAQAKPEQKFVTVTKKVDVNSCTTDLTTSWGSVRRGLASGMCKDPTTRVRCTTIETDPVLWSIVACQDLGFGK